MSLAIIQSPHSKNPKGIWDEIRKMEAQDVGTLDYMDAELDRSAFRALKRAVKQNQRSKK